MGKTTKYLFQMDVVSMGIANQIFMRKVLVEVLHELQSLPSFFEGRYEKKLTITKFCEYAVHPANPFEIPNWPDSGVGADGAPRNVSPQVTSLDFGLLDLI